MYDHWTELLWKVQGMVYLLTLPLQAEETLTTLQAL